MPNDSSTGGFLLASSVNGDLNDNALIDFLQTVVVGITGFPGAMVRPRQAEPPNIPTSARIGRRSARTTRATANRTPTGRR